MDKKLLGVIDATTYQEGLEPFVDHRSLAALPFGGRYRLIDFILSNMVNSGIRSVAIFPKFQYRSLMDHLGSGKDWELNRKRDGLFFFPSQINSDGIGSFTHFAENMDYFQRSTQQYALIANCYTVANIDFRKVLEAHIHAKCDITEVRKDGRSMEMYLVKLSLLTDLIEKRRETGYSSMKDVVTDLNHSYKICNYEYNGYVNMIDSISSYYQSNMSLLNSATWKNLFTKEHPIYTKVKDEPPTHYLNGSNVLNSVIANGCQIEGHVENCIIFRGVKVGKGSVIKNSIIMQKSQIGENCVLDSCIFDKDVKVEPCSMMRGSMESPFVVRKGTIQGALMKS